ncbi:MAG: hypothetical protein OEX19_09795 [Gammaproteobacteria bacterium]|nr:hypothetical protein [Gammaproteobacteria bacterium]
MLKNENRIVVYLADYLPITSYITVFESIWNRDFPCSYVLDMEGVNGFESGILGLVVLFKQYVAKHNRQLEFRNEPKRWTGDWQKLFL